MRLPRDVSGTDLAHALARHGYVVTRQTGAHLRLSREGADGTHHITIPAHKALRAGTLSAILRAVGQHLGMTRDDLVRDLFG